MFSTPSIFSMLLPKFCLRRVIFLLNSSEVYRQEKMIRVMNFFGLSVVRWVRMELSLVSLGVSMSTWVVGLLMSVMPCLKNLSEALGYIKEPTS